MGKKRDAVDIMLDGVEWIPTGATPGDDGIPVATHTGQLNVGGLVLDCAVLSNGQRVFFGELVETLMGIAEE